MTVNSCPQAEPIAIPGPAPSPQCLAWPASCFMPLKVREHLLHCTIAAVAAAAAAAASLSGGSFAALCSTPGGEEGAEEAEKKGCFCRAKQERRRQHRHQHRQPAHARQ